MTTKPFILGNNQDKIINNSAATLSTELSWLKELIQHQIRQLLSSGENDRSPPLPTAPQLNSSSDKYGEFILKHEFNMEERCIVILALAPHLNPAFLDETIAEVTDRQGDFPQIGGVRGKSFRGILPTVETTLFILAGSDLDKRFHIQRCFLSTHTFADKKIITVEGVEPGEPATSGRLTLDPEYVELFTLGEASTPQLSLSFPAQRMYTDMEWDDLVLPEWTFARIREIERWVLHNSTFLADWGMAKRIKPGYRVLFYGPPGTGKTLTVCLLGKHTRRPVYRVDLSTVVSKFIGETEKNLESLFHKARHKDWILLFDEADALFGKRTGIRDAHDKYANQEVSYLLQRIEEHPGLIILASNYKSNIDEAFSRRFQSVIHFPQPKARERVTLWKSIMPRQAVAVLDSDIDLAHLAARYELTGAQITNIVQHVCLQSLDSDNPAITLDAIVDAVKKEIAKENKVVN